MRMPKRNLDVNRVRREVRNMEVAPELVQLVDELCAQLSVLEAEVARLSSPLIRALLVTGDIARERVQKALREFEVRYEMTTAEMLARKAAGDWRDTAEMARWAVLAEGLAEQHGCEHGCERPALPGRRFCSEECSACERGEKDCAVCAEVVAEALKNAPTQAEVEERRAAAAERLAEIKRKKT